MRRARAAGTLAGGFSLAVFVLVYARLAPRLPWLPTLAGATLAFGLMTLVMENFTLPVVPLWLGVIAGFLLVIQLLPRGLATKTPRKFCPAGTSRCA